ncbi:ATP-binding protein [Candidatus Contubernalis alkaliaceticus]|uniref:ATP-binding protein n=1 Tax=Candidatus Contubernalis alkaliaceticus TaxID=338645 RepID=UPI001F4BE28D|nr:ATP-binding protein [Candidatus Contubernalis alkalaceticus]UNC91041.1 ATP-binding protein [Candidatus Contubernalis alkalaceticus]
MTKIFLSSNLTIPNDFQYLSVALNYIKSVANLFNFSQKELRDIELAAEEAVSNVIEHAFLPGETASLDINCEETPTGLKISIHDQGIPFDPNLTPEYQLTGDLETQEITGLGSYMIKKLMDEVEYCNLGTEGKSTIMKKYYPADSVMDDADRETPPDEKPDKVPEDKKVKVDVRQMLSTEAVEVSRCFFDAYGYSYVHDNVYYPERLAALNQSGDIYSAVAVSPWGEVASHAALVYHKAFPGISEFAMLATKAKYRGQSLISKLQPNITMEALNRGLSGSFANAVTKHVYSQHVLKKFGYRECGFLLAHSPENTVFKGITEKTEQRGTVLVSFMFVNDPSSDPISVFAPLKHWDFIKKIYENLGVTAVLAEEGISVKGHNSAKEELEKKKMQATMEEFTINPRRMSAIIRFKQIGADFKSCIHKILYQIKKEKLQVAELFLSLKDPATPEAAEILEEIGFLVTGIIPGTTDGDLLIMQYFNGIVIDYDQIILASEKVRDMLTYIRQNDPLEGGN